MFCWVFGSALLRLILVGTAKGSTSIYGPLAAPIAVLLWLYLLSIAVLIGAALNASFDQIWPQKELTTARLERLRRLKLENVLPVALLARARGVGRRRGGPVRRGQRPWRGPAWTSHPPDRRRASSRAPDQRIIRCGPAGRDVDCRHGGRSLTAVRVPRHEEKVGCVLAREIGVLVVLTDVGPVRASYGARMLGQIARDRSRVPEPGEWVALRRWYDGPVTVERTLSRHRAPRPSRRSYRCRPRHLRVAPAARSARVPCFTRGKRDPADPRLPGRRRAVPGRRIPRRLGRRTRHPGSHHRHAWSASTPHDAKLCLEGDAIKDQDGRRLRPGTCAAPCARAPVPRSPPRATTSASSPCAPPRTPTGDSKRQVVIYGDVVD